MNLDNLKPYEWRFSNGVCSVRHKGYRGAAYPVHKGWKWIVRPADQWEPTIVQGETRRKGEAMDYIEDWLSSLPALPEFDAHEDERREAFWAAFNARFAKLKADPEAWAEFQRENAVWDATLGDGLPKEDGQ